MNLTFPYLFGIINTGVNYWGYYTGFKKDYFYKTLQLFAEGILIYFMKWVMLTFK